MIDHSDPVVRFACEDDSDAERLTAVIGALGFRAVREVSEKLPSERLARAVTRIARHTDLTRREAEVLGLVIDCPNNQAIADRLKIDRATVKWHMHNVHRKTRCTNRAALLRILLREVASDI